MDLMAIRRGLIASQQAGGLPSEYQRVKWLGNEGTQYINTGYAPKVSPRIETLWMSAANADRDRFGFLENVSPSFIVDAASVAFYNRWGDTSSTTITVDENLAGRLIYCTFGKNTNINDEATATFNDANWETNVQEMYLFRGRNISAGMRIYNCKLYDGNSLVGNYIPCIRKTDSVAGMYDTVTKTFLTNAGTGTFGYETLDGSIVYPT